MDIHGDGTPGSAPREPLLVFRDVWKSFREGEGERTLFRGLSLSVAPGEAVALAGPSGSGKSTLLNLAAAIDLPDRGEVRVAGVDLVSASERERSLFRRRRAGIVFQSFLLLPTLTVEENVLLPLELAGVRGGRERALELLDAVGLASRRGAWPDRLSGGERQRVAVARALVHRPDLVLADEPTGNLDARSGGAVLDLLLSLVRREGRTLLLATHSASAAGRCDRVLSIRDGLLAEEGGRRAGDAPEATPVPTPFPPAP